MNEAHVEKNVFYDDDLVVRKLDLTAPTIGLTDGPEKKGCDGEDRKEPGEKAEKEIKIQGMPELVGTGTCTWNNLIHDEKEDRQTGEEREGESIKRGKEGGKKKNNVRGGFPTNQKCGLERRRRP